jgi:imidazolonepropionase-like amidohydrolase
VSASVLPAWLLIEGASVIDGSGSAPREGVSVLVQGDRIHSVAADIDVDRTVPRAERDGLVTIDASGKTLMPGMVDAHCHMSYGESRTQEEQDLYTSVELRTLRAAFNAKKVLRAGVTGISQPGGSYYIGVGIREAIKEGIVVGPRMTAAGRYITTSNGLADFYPESVGVPDGSIGFVANTQAEMTDAIRRQVKNGVDLIKLADSPYGEFQAFSNDELKANADLAHQLGKRITIHARGSAEVSGAVDAGFDWIMHGNVMTDETIDKLAASKIPLVPTLLLLANLADFGGLVGSPMGQRDGCRRMLDKTAVTLHKAHDAGVTFVTGTDTGFSVTPYGEWHARELELLMTYAGLSELEAIQAATKNAAVTLKMAGEVGEVAEGMVADLIVVDGDPSRDIRVLQDKRRITTVIKGGRVIEFDEAENDRRWPHERAIIYSVGDLTYDVVYAGATPVADPPLPWDTVDALDLSGTIRSREVGARIPAE